MQTIDHLTVSDTTAHVGDSALGTPGSEALPVEQDRERAAAAVAMAEALLRRSHEIERTSPSADRKKQGRLHALIVHEPLAQFTRTLTDEIARIADPTIAGRRFATVAAHADTSALGRFDRWQIRIGAVAARALPKVVMPLVLHRLRGESDGVVIFDSEPGLTRHLRKRIDSRGASNINILGEAILGNDEAAERLRLIHRALDRPDVNYVSVKLSAICASISALAFDATVAAVSEPLRDLYRHAASFPTPKFINLDMEEYRDLALTMAAFTAVLSESEFRGLDAGIVLQAYLPDAYAAAGELAEWALARRNGGGGQTKIRVVKGANLAMERVEAELHGWEQAPYSSKTDVDANYKAVLDRLLEPRYDDAVRVGLASHNLFDIGWGLTSRDRLAERSVAHRLEFEMLEGMASSQAAALTEKGVCVLRYTPVVRPADFTAAIAYLVRRLDENTSPDNFLHHVFDLVPGNAIFEAEAFRFTAAVSLRSTVAHEPRRTQNRTLPISADDLYGPFCNEADTDFALPWNRIWIEHALSTWTPPISPLCPVVAGSERVATRADHRGLTENPGVTDGAGLSTVMTVALPSSPFGSYAVNVASRELVEECVLAARAAGLAWAERSRSERALLINAVGDIVSARRGEILATMAHDAGKTITEGDPEVSEAVDFARYYARRSLELDRVAGAIAAPLGTVLITPPWNFPFAIPLGGILASVAAGNAVILKPAPQTVLTARLVAECCWDAGIPRDLVQFLPCADDEVGQALVTHPGIDAVILTGGLSTAELFHSWKPSLRLHAETSGKNAMVITAAADVEQAIKDLVRSAFGHAGQKCSATSLAIVDASVYDDPSFFRRLADATRTLVAGPGHDLRTDVGPLIDPPTGNLLRALTVLEPGEQWLVKPSPLFAGASVDQSPQGDECSDETRLWSPGIRVGVAGGSWFHRNECFGPVLGVMRAEDLDHAIGLQNATPFGLTAGIHSLDPSEVDRWSEAVEAGNLYVNRGTTGAIVQRQPFGGWKRSVVGPTVKAGGPRYVASLCQWTEDQSIATNLSQDLGAIDTAWRTWAATELNAEHDPSGLRAETNVLRFRPLPHGVIVIVGPGAPAGSAELAEFAARRTDCAVRVVRVQPTPGRSVRDVVASLSDLPADRVRLLGTVDQEIRAEAHRLGLAVDDSPINASPELELPRWLREQSVTVVRHRHGHLTREAHAEI